MFLLTPFGQKTGRLIKQQSVFRDLRKKKFWVIFLRNSWKTRFSSRNFKNWQLPETSTDRFPPPLFLWMAVRWLRLKQTQANCTLLFYLSLSPPPGGDEHNFWVGWFILAWLQSSRKFGNVTIDKVQKKMLCSIEISQSRFSRLNRRGVRE